MAPETVFALALGFGVLAQVVAAKIGVPSIAILFLVGVALGPDGASWIRPRELGAGLYSLVSLAVAVILFEGALNLDLRRLRREGTTIRALITTGALITWVGAGIAAHAFLGWSWEISLLFGAMVIVTGPTVIGPLLRGLRVRSNVATVLEAESILIDPIGALAAALTLEAVLAPSADTLLATAASVVPRVAFGAAVGTAGGALMALALRSSRLIRPGLEGLFVLGGVLVTFTLCNVVLSESGILAVVAEGVALANLATRLPEGLREFKGYLTEGLIGVLFVLLAADVGLEDMLALGPPVFATVAALVLVVRPLDVLVSTSGSGLSWRERAFIAWLGPRGIVAAAIASLGAASLEAHGLPDGGPLRALVFLTIAVTVLVSGGLGGVVAWLLGVRTPERAGALLLGGDRTGLALAEALRAGGCDVTVLDANAEHCRAAEAAGFPVVFGNALEEVTLERARPELAARVIALTTNESVNLLFAREVLERFEVPEAYIALEPRSRGVPRETLQRLGIRALFGGPRDVARWNVRFRHGQAEVRRFRCEAPPAPGPAPDPSPADPFLILAVERARRVQPMHRELEPKAGDEAQVALLVERRDEALAALAALGWKPA